MSICDRNSALCEDNDVSSPWAFPILHFWLIENSLMHKNQEGHEGGGGWGEGGLMVSLVRVDAIRLLVCDFGRNRKISSWDFPGPTWKDKIMPGPNNKQLSLLKFPYFLVFKVPSTPLELLRLLRLIGWVVQECGPLWFRLNAALRTTWMKFKQNWPHSNAHKLKSSRS